MQVIVNFEPRYFRKEATAADEIFYISLRRGLAHQTGTIKNSNLKIKDGRLGRYVFLKICTII